jgi:signal transduction histidine kinase
LFAAPTGAVESFFTSPRSVYLYAFVLVAGLLAFGLVFTVRTLSHQLALSRMQSDFVSTVSHEFKSPVTAIRQLAEMLRAGRVPSEDRRQRYYDVLVEQSERLTALMDHILDFAKMDAGYELERRETDPGEHLEEVASRVEHRVRHRGYAVRREIDEDLPVVNLDPDAIALAVTNLIDNGIKYSGDAREVVLRAAARNGDLEIAVQDFGVGVDPADREHVFERFYRGGNPLTRSVKGTGLGLTLVKQIVDAHGGSIDVRSEPGEGSTFTIRLPTGAT